MVANDLPLSSEVSVGVPSHPLYKRLASSLYQSIDSGALCSSYKELIPAHEGLNLRKIDEELNKLIIEKGSALLSVRNDWEYYMLLLIGCCRASLFFCSDIELLQVLKEANFELHVQEPFFSLLSGIHLL